MSVSYGGDSITFADGSVTSSGWTGFKNRIINGAITIDQRANTQMGLANTASYYYFADRWTFYQDTTGLVGTVRPSSTAPAGFSSSIAVTVTTGNTASASHQNILSHWIEGVHTQDLAWGTASAAPVTLSFWVRSSITGTNGGMISNAAYDRNYTFSYTVNAQNTWEYKTITIPGDQSGTWTAGAGGTGIRLRFNTGSGANYLGTANVWSSGIYNAPTGSFSTIGTSGATLYFTGLQLERGSSASSFEYRPFHVELMMCQKYYERISAVSTQQLGGYGHFGTGAPNASNAGTGYFWCQYQVPKRTTPSFNYNGSYRWQSTAGSDAATTTALSASSLSNIGAILYFNSGSGGTVGYWGMAQFMTATSYLEFSAELT